MFAADFPVGFVEPITLSLVVPDPQFSGPCPSQLPCYLLYGDIVTSTPEPATLSILGAALGIFLMARRSVRRPTEGPPEDLAGA
jgi:hypothetical protein